MKQEEINKILENHLHWLREDCDGWEKMRANFYKADLCKADLCGADLCGANLCGANLCGANLYGADLCKADLCKADLCEANLYEANLCEADLREANLRGANLRGANLYGADLCEADLFDAYLYGANLCEADLREANLCGARNVPLIPMACPDKGSFIGYKKAHGYIVELEICEDARRNSATGRKCRCDKARVISITTIDGEDAGVTEVASNYVNGFIYKVGEIVEEPNFCEDRFKECAEGIHFFINRQEAVDY